MSDLRVVPDGGSAYRKPFAGRATALERASVRIPLIHLLAVGEARQVDLAVRFGVSQSAICQFAGRHRAEIEAVRVDFEQKILARIAALR